MKSSLKTEGGTIPPLALRLPQRVADLFVSPWGIFTQLNLRHKLYAQYNNKYMPSHGPPARLRLHWDQPGRTKNLAGVPGKMVPGVKVCNLIRRPLAVHGPEKWPRPQGPVPGEVSTCPLTLSPAGHQSTAWNFTCLSTTLYVASV